MPTTEERIRKLVDDNLLIEGRPEGQALNPDSSLRETGASSMAIVALLIKLIEEFELRDVSPEEFAEIRDFGGLIEFVDSRAGRLTDTPSHP